MGSFTIILEGFKEGARGAQPTIFNQKVNPRWGLLGAAGGGREGLGEGLAVVGGTTDGKASWATEVLTPHLLAGHPVSGGSGAWGRSGSALQA